MGDLIWFYSSDKYMYKQHFSYIIRPSLKQHAQELSYGTELDVVFNKVLILLLLVYGNMSSSQIVAWTCHILAFLFGGMPKSQKE